MLSNQRESLRDSKNCEKTSKVSRDFRSGTGKKPQRRSSIHQHTQRLIKSELFGLVNEQSEESTQISEQGVNYREVTERIQRQVINSLHLFKEANSDYIKNTEQLTGHVLSFNKDLAVIKDELLEINKEKEESLEELERLKKIFNNPQKFITLKQFHTENEADEYVFEKLRLLRQEVTALKKRVTTTEQLIVNNEETCKEISSKSNKKETNLECDEKHVKCSSCIII